MRVVTSVTEYRSCVVEYGAGRAVHCPELNACFLDDCNAVHFGYAIPISIVSVAEDPNLAELVFDGSEGVDPVVAGYLLSNHPDFEEIREEMKGVDMAKHDHVRKYAEPEEDIAAIAKQISDHAEAIYQTWKSRGLAPTEILTCHGGATAADKFGSALTPKASPAKTPAAHKSRSIQYALQKFEKGGSAAAAAAAAAEHTKYRPQPTQISRPVPANQIQLRSLDTIEVMLPEEVVGRPAKRAAESEGSDGGGSRGASTWPLKNRTDPRKNSEEYLDEVRREEERLINALKCGMIINEDATSAAEGLPQCDDTSVALKNAVLGSMRKKDAGFSLVDYAKIRYKNAQENPLTQQRLEHAKEFDKVTGTRSDVVSVAKNRFESQKDVAWRQREEWQETTTAAADDGDRGKAKARPRHAETVPHPELTTQQRQHLRQSGSNPVRPFLTRGSVAERVLIFEKCPSELLLDKRRNAPAITAWRTGSEVQSKAQARTRKGCYACEFFRVQQELGVVAVLQPRFPYVPPKRRLPRSYNKTYAKEKEKQNQRSTQPLHTTLRRHTKANKNVFIPRFYFPQGKPQAQGQVDAVLQKLAADFRTFPMGQIPREKFHIVVKSCECPLYWKVPLFAAAGGDKLGHVDAHGFLDFWKQLTATCHDSASKFLKILVRGTNRNFLLPEDFIPLIQDVVDTHPGLTFLKEANEFHSRYIHTVIARIFYCVNRSWSGRISLPELRRSNLLQVISLLEEEEDINQITQYFSYEHFYVIYCKFWELDTDHDLFIDRQDLTRHNDHALSTRMIDRIFSGAVTRGSSSSSKSHDDRMSYTEFVWFLLSEEDKQHPTAVEYWFRCMDLDGDGVLSMYELEYFYEEQLQRMELLGIETLPFEDCLCQMLDMIRPQVEGRITLSDLKKCKMVTIFFDTFFNLEKYLDREQRDPFASQRDMDGDGEMSDWDRYAAEEYEMLVAEEGMNEHNEESMYGYLDQSDEEMSSPTESGLDAFDVPYTINAHIIPVNLEPTTTPTTPMTPPPTTTTTTPSSNIQSNGSGGVQIQIKCPSSQAPQPSPAECPAGDGGWDSTRA